MTEYVVLRREIAQGDQGESWSVVGDPVEATNDVAAIKAVAKRDGVDLSMGAVATPARSWRPRKPERKVSETTLWT